VKRARLSSGVKAVPKKAMKTVVDIDLNDPKHLVALTTYAKQNLGVDENGTIVLWKHVPHGYMRTPSGLVKPQPPLETMVYGNLYTEDQEKDATDPPTLLPRTSMVCSSGTVFYDEFLKGWFDYDEECKKKQDAAGPIGIPFGHTL
jgi:hypothetical protein